MDKPKRKRKTNTELGYKTYKRLPRDPNKPKRKYHTKRKSNAPGRPRIDSFDRNIDAQSLIRRSNLPTTRLIGPVEQHYSKNLMIVWDDIKMNRNKSLVEFDTRIKLYQKVAPRLIQFLEKYWPEGKMFKNGSYHPNVDIMKLSDFKASPILPTCLIFIHPGSCSGMGPKKNKYIKYKHKEPVTTFKYPKSLINKKMLMSRLIYYFNILSRYPTWEEFSIQIDQDSRKSIHTITWPSVKTRYNEVRC